MEFPMVFVNAIRHLVPAFTKYTHAGKVLNRFGLCNAKRGLRLQKGQSPDAIAEMPTYEYAKETGKKGPKKRVYVWGFAQYGALGIPSYVKPTDRYKRPLKQQHRPAKLDFIDKHEILDVSCGYGFTILSISSKTSYKVFGMGLNSDSQIGYHAPRREAPLELIIGPVPIGIPFKTPETTKVKQVACGRAHTIVLTDNEGVFSLGNNSYGQCGRPIVENEEYRGSSRVFKSQIETENVDQIICGQDNTIFVTDSGEVLTCGWNADGQTGSGHYNNVWKPSKVIGDVNGERIIQVSCAADCVLALSDKGDVFGWGNSEYGQLSSITSTQQVHTSYHLRKLKECGEIVQVASAGTMCAVLNSEGQVYVWGYGLLGKGPATQHSLDPTPIPSTLFGHNQFNTDVKVTKLSCGLNHFVAITNKGDLYAWGRNKMSCLGLGHEKDQYFPLRVQFEDSNYKSEFIKTKFPFLVGFSTRKSY